MYSFSLRNLFYFFPLLILSYHGGVIVGIIRVIFGKMTGEATVWKMAISSLSPRFATTFSRTANHIFTTKPRSHWPEVERSWGGSSEFCWEA